MCLHIWLYPHKEQHQTTLTNFLHNYCNQNIDKLRHKEHREGILDNILQKLFNKFRKNNY